MENRSITNVGRRRCTICGKPVYPDKEQYQCLVDYSYYCRSCFSMLIAAGLLYEGADDDWHVLPNIKFDILK